MVSAISLEFFIIAFAIIAIVAANDALGDDIVLSDGITVEQSTVGAKVEVGRGFDPCICTDTEWCNIPMPTKSHFNFAAPDNAQRWLNAACLAARGDQVLARRVLQHFPDGSDMLDGDIRFRNWKAQYDIHFNAHENFREIVSRGVNITSTDWSRQRSTLEVRKLIKTTNPPAKSLYERQGEFVGGLRPAGRSNFMKPRFPVIGFANRFFMKKEELLPYWNANKHLIDTPFVAVFIRNENWGFLSSLVPNRTATWTEESPMGSWLLEKFLADPMVIAVFSNQHHNYSHPKIISTPRGLPDASNAKLLHSVLRNTSGTSGFGSRKKDKLLLAAASNWGRRK